MKNLADKELLIVGGPNGAGKTTFAEEYADRHAWKYLSADLVAAQLCPSDPASEQINAARQFLALLHDALAGSESFIVESTLSGRTLCKHVELAKRAGFTITLVYLFLDSADECVARVNERVQKGGHFVPEIDIRRRYQRSAVNFWQRYRPLSDQWVLIYNSGVEGQDVAAGTATSHAVRDQDLFAAFQTIVEANND